MDSEQLPSESGAESTQPRFAIDQKTARASGGDPKKGAAARPLQEILHQGSMEITPELAARILAETGDPVGNELSNSGKMKPYINFFAAQMKGVGVEAAARVVEGLDLKDRYLWRVASALQWAFADFDSETAKLDWLCLPEEQRKQVEDALLLQIRLTQMAFLMKALYGQEGEENSPASS